MKRIIILICIVFVSTLGFSQMENIKISNDSSIVINKLYVGMLSGSMFSVDSLYADKFVDLRFGVLAEWKINKVVSLQGLGMFSTNLSNNTWGLQQIYFNITPNDKHLFQIGHMATLSTEQRPHPISAGGQFETYTESQIPGQALGMQYAFMPNDNLLFGVGVAYRNNKAEYHGKLKVKKFTLSGYYGMSEKSGGLAFTYDGNRIYNTFVWKDSNIVSNVFVFKLMPKAKVDIYADLGYDLYDKDLVRGEIGLLKNFSSQYIKGFFGFSYQQSHTVNGYLFIHL